MPSVQANHDTVGRDTKYCDFVSAMKTNLSDVQACKHEEKIYISRLKCISLHEFSTFKRRYCKEFHLKSCQECPLLINFSLAVYESGLCELSEIYKKHFGTYKSVHAVRRCMQLPVVIFAIRTNRQRLFITEYRDNIDFKKFISWYKKISDLNTEVSSFSKDQLNALCKLASTESDRMLLKYAVCESQGLSAKKAQKDYGFDDMKGKRVQILQAVERSEEIHKAVNELGALEDKALLRSVGIMVADSDDSDSGLSDNETNTVDILEDESGHDEASTCMSVETSDSSEIAEEVDQAYLHTVLPSAEVSERNDDSNKRTSSDNSPTVTQLSFHPDSGLKGVPIVNPSLSNDTLLLWLRENSLNWFSLVRELCQYLNNYSNEVINQCLEDFGAFISESDLTEEEEKVVEISRQAYLSVCRDTNTEITDTESDSDGEDWVDIKDLQSEKIPDLVLKEMKKRQRKRKRVISSHIANERLLKRKITPSVSKTLQRFPNIGKDIENYVSAKRVGADKWRRTGVLTFSGNTRQGPKCTFRSIKDHLEKKYKTHLGYGTVVQLCVIRNKRHLSAKRYQGAANVTCRRARKGFSIKLNPDSHWSGALYKCLDWIQFTDGTDKVVLNRDDQAGFRLDTTSTHKIGKSINLQTEPTLTTRTDFVNSYKSVIQTTSYLFMETQTTPVGCCGIVKPHFTYQKNPAQHMADLEMLESDSELNVFLKDRPIDCIRVDGASDEGPSHIEVQFLWGERHYRHEKVCTLITTRESGGSFLNKVELMNGCIAKAHANLFIPSTLNGSNKCKTGFDENKIRENMDTASDVYMDHVNGAPCLGSELMLRKGSKESQFIQRREETLVFLKGKKKEKDLLKKNNPELYAHLQKVMDMINRHTVKQYQSKYIFMLLPCFQKDCIHSICKKGRTESNYNQITWFPEGPHVSYLPVPVKDDTNPGHFLGPDMNYKYACENFKADNGEFRLTELPSEICKEPPSEILKKSFLSKDNQPCVDELSKKTLLPPSEIELHLKDMTEIAVRRKEGAQKAKETRKKNQGIFVLAQLSQRQARCLTSLIIFVSN